MNLGLSLSLGGMRAGGGGPTPTPTPSFTAAPAASIDFNQRNGDSANTGAAQRWLAGPTLTNVFGDRNSANTTGGMLPGLLAIRLWHRPGNAVSSDISASGINQNQQVFGSATSLSTRSARMTWYGTQSSNTAFRDRFVWQGQFANSVAFGDIDPSTGAGGSASALRGLRTGTIDPHRFEPVTLFLRMNDAGRLQAFHAFADGTLVAGDFFDHAATAGFATGNAACSFGRAGTGASFQNSWSGSMRDFVQVNNLDVTDADMTALAQGADPATLFGASLYAHYRMSGPTDLTLTAGSSGYASLTLNDTDSQARAGCALAPSLAGTRGIQLLPEFAGFVHALPPVSVRNAANRAAVKALTAPCIMRVRVTGAGTTHVWGRLLRQSDSTVLVDWTKMTSSPVSAGDHDMILPGAPVGADFIREVGAEDALCVSRDSQAHRAGIVAAIIGQSQQNIMWSSAATGADTASSNGAVSVMASYPHRMTTPTNGPVAGMRLDRPALIGGAVYELAKHWQAANDGIPLQLVMMTRGGTAREEWMDNSVTQLWGDSADPTTGMVPATVLAARQRFTVFLENWHTSDQGIINGGGLPAANDELYLGIGSTGSRRNFTQFPLVNPVWVAGVPFIRHRSISGTAPSEANRNTFETARIALRDYYQGTGGSANILRDNAAYMTALAMGPIGEGPHQRTDDVRGNAYYGLWTAMALARMAKLYTADVEATFTSATRSGAVLTLAISGTGLQTMTDNLTPTGFEVSEDAGVTWSRSNGTIAYTVARSGDTVTLTRGSGNWPANTQVRYLFGYPWDIPPGNDATAFAAETTAVDQMLAITNASAPLGRVPLRPTLGALVAA
jgi:hypothetical protein